MVKPSAVSVIMPVRNERSGIADVLADLDAQDWPHPFEVVVADGASTDGTRELLASHERTQPYRFHLRLVDNPQRHIPHGLNAAVAAATGTWIVRVDGHARLPPGYIAGIVGALQAGTADLVGPRIHLEAGADTVMARLIAACLSSPLGTGGTPSRGRLAAPRYVAHTVMSCYARFVWVALGGYDENLLSNEDFDFDWRAVAAGFRVASLPEPVFHLTARATLPALMRQRWRYGWWKAAVIRKEPASLGLRQIVPVGALAALPALVVAGMWWPLPSAAVLGAYLLASWGAVVATLIRRGARPSDWCLALALAPLVFAIIHFVWAAAVCAGLVRRRRPAATPPVEPTRLAALPLPPGVRRVAIIHEWLEVWGGSEQVMRALLDLFPQADLHVLVDVLDPVRRRWLGERTVRTSFIQRLPLAHRLFRRYIPLFPLAIEQFDLSAYDLVISSSHAVAKGVIVRPDARHICYCHSPMRYAWDLQPLYLRQRRAEGLASLPIRLLLHYLRLWDVRSAAGVDLFLANSGYIAQRIARCYRRKAVVVPPPVEIGRFRDDLPRDDFYLVASRLVPYKCVPLVVQAFARLPGRRLVVVGDGPDLAEVRAVAGAGVVILGHVDDERLAALLGRARALVFAAEEDFGILPVEALASGTPVIAYGRGGVCDTVADGEDGVLFHEQTPAAIAAAVERFEALPAFAPQRLRQRAARCAPERFREAIARAMDAAVGAGDRA